MKPNVLVVCHSNRSLGALEVVKFLAQEATHSTNNSYHFGIFKGMKIDKKLMVAYEVNQQSFLQRMLFERIQLPKIIKREQYDYVLSLQNFVVKNYNIPTGLLVHQGLLMMSYPFPAYEVKLRIKVLILKLLFRLFKRHVNDFYVQLPWMKESLIQTYKVSANRIHIVRTHQVQSIKQSKPKIKQQLDFIYPASGFHYKNHLLVIDALSLLNDESLKKLHVSFTLNQSENKYSRLLTNAVKEKQLPIEFIGSLKHDKLLECYSNNVLLFASCVESQGFPLIEAMHAGATIVCIDLPYARETLANYEYAMYFDSAKRLAEIFVGLINGNYKFDKTQQGQTIESPSLISQFEEVHK